MGSIGVGCTIDKGVAAWVKPYTNTLIYLNGKKISLPTVATVVELLKTGPILIDLYTDLPLGCGFGTSAASALSTAYVINQVLKLGKTEEELAKIVHLAEIKNKTGLGSVTTQITGGFLLKKSAGFPVISKNFPFIDKKLYVVVIDKLETPSVLKDERKLQLIDAAAEKALGKISKLSQISLEEIIDVSYEFALESRLLENKEVISLIEDIRRSGGYATMAMLGQTVISNIKPNTQKYPVIKLQITKDKVHLIW